MVQYFSRLLVIKNRTIIFQSDSLWQVKDFLVADLNNDKADELALVVWKKGSFGKVLPFWLKENDKEYGSHLFIFKLDDQKLMPLWQSSKLENPICKVKVVKNKQSENIMMVEEGIYKGNNYSCRKIRATNWQWNGWGFTKID